MYAILENRLRKRRGGWGDKYISSYIFFYMAKVIALILFFNKIINKLLHITI